MKTNQLSKNQSGFASLVIGLILIVVIALLTVGFAQLTRHEQKQALNNLQATQAYYAAETGINDAVKSITTGALSSPGTGCINLPAPYAGKSIISANASYSCVMVNMTPDSIVKSLGAGEAYTTVAGTGALTLDHLTINWTKGSASSFHGAGAKFTPSADWVYPAVVQFSITPLGAGYGRDQLINNTFTILMDPTTSASRQSVAYSTLASSQGDIATGKCSSAADCSVKITGLSGVSGPFLIHFISYYKPTTVSISGQDSTNATINFTGSQAVVDATGKAWDVLKRLEVHVPLNNVNALAHYGLEARDICKRLQAQPTAVTYFDSTGASTTSISDPCYPG